MRNRDMRLVAASALLFVVSAAHAIPAQGSIWNAPRTFSLNDENDALGGSSDSAYTQGLRLRWTFGAWPQSSGFQSAIAAINLSWLAREARAENPCSPAEPRRTRPCGMTSFAIAQTEYTPPNLLATTRNDSTRPYAGYLFGTLGYTTMFERWSATTSVDVGIVGPLSGAQATQSLAHWTWSHNSPEPRGWDNQLHNAPQITLRNTYAVSAFERCARAEKCDGSFDEDRWFDIVPQGEVVLGTLMDRASLGVTAHLGYRFADLSTPYRIPTTAPRTLDRAKTEAGSHFQRDAGDFLKYVQHSGWFMVSGSFDARGVARNDLLTGTYNDQGANDWGPVHRIRLNPMNTEQSFGFSLGVERAAFTYQRVKRSSEYRPSGGVHTFGSFAITIFSPERGG
jgi:hypothetical protein